MKDSTALTLDPSALTAFAASLSTLPAEEVRKAKQLFLRNALSDARATLTSTKSMLVVFGVMSLIPLFLLIFIPALISYRALRRNLKEKLRNATEVWADELGAARADLLAEIDAL